MGTSSKTENSTTNLLLIENDLVLEMDIAPLKISGHINYPKHEEIDTSSVNQFLIPNISKLAGASRDLETQFEDLDLLQAQVLNLLRSGNQGVSQKPEKSTRTQTYLFYCQRI
jgi:hypothetical protein